MPASYLPYQPDQDLLPPPSLKEWLPEGHLAYFISDTVDSLDLAAFHARYAGRGPRNQPFDPAMMVKVLVYAYASGVFSSRKSARRLREDVAFRVLAAGNHPAGRAGGDRPAPRPPAGHSGSTPASGAAPAASRTRTRRDPDNPPRGGRYQRPFDVPEDKAQENFTDPDSRIMKRSGGGFDASYNAQTAVDERAHIIVAAELTNSANDAAELPKLLAAVKSNLAQKRAQVLADTGYRSEAVFEELADSGIDEAVAIGREGKQQLPFHAIQAPTLGSHGSQAVTPAAPSRRNHVQAHAAQARKLHHSQMRSTDSGLVATGPPPR